MSSAGDEQPRADKEAVVDDDKQGNVAITAMDRRIGRGVLFVAMVALGYQWIGESFQMGYEWLSGDRSESFMAIVFSYAWFVYLLMGVFWVVEERLWKVIPLTGTVAGTISVLSIAAGILPFLIVLPHVIFAYHLARYHLGQID